MKAISPIIAGVVLLAVALIAGLMVSTWSSTLVTKQTEKSPMCTLTTYYSIESAKYNLASGIIKIKITNRGKDDIYNFSIEADNGSITTITPISPASTYKLKQGRSIYLKGYKTNLGNLNNIRVIPSSCPQKIAQLKVNNIDLTGNLVLNLHLDSVNTTNWTQDDSGNNNHGQLMNGTASCYDSPTCPQLVQGKYGNAIKFDGTDDYVDCGNNGSLNITDAITIEAWVKTTQMPTDWTSFVSKKDAYAIQFNQTTPKARIYIYNGSEWYGVNSQVLINDGEWHHVVGSYDGYTLKIYINGNLENTYTISTSINLNTNHLFIGKEQGKNNFNGTIDEVRIWNRALTADEIIELAS